MFDMCVDHLFGHVLWDVGLCLDCSFGYL